jgi:hypothetical protein
VFFTRGGGNTQNIMRRALFDAAVIVVKLFEGLNVWHLA